MSPRSRIRYEVVRRADALDDHKTASQILAGETSSQTQEDLQEYELSQIKRIIFGAAPGEWNSDFLAIAIKSLKELTELTDPAKLYERVPLIGPYDGVTRVYYLPVPALHDSTANGPKVKLFHGGRALAHATTFGTDVPEYRMSESTPALGYDTITLTFAPTQLLLADFVAK